MSFLVFAMDNSGCIRRMKPIRLSIFLKKTVLFAPFIYYRCHADDFINIWLLQKLWALIDTIDVAGRLVITMSITNRIVYKLLQSKLNDLSCIYVK